MRVLEGAAKAIQIFIRQSGLQTCLGLKPVQHAAMVSSRSASAWVCQACRAKVWQISSVAVTVWQALHACKLESQVQSSVDLELWRAQYSKALRSPIDILVFGSKTQAKKCCSLSSRAAQLPISAVANEDALRRPLQCRCLQAMRRLANSCATEPGAVKAANA